jgi:outer membrane receptor protein involved in Fe transport
MRTTKQATILCLAAAAAAIPAAADDHVPRSLRMREPRPARTRWNQTPLGRRVAQVPPDGSPSDAPDDPTPTPAADPRSTPPDSSTPPAPADPRSTPPDSSTPPAPADPPPAPTRPAPAASSPAKPTLDGAAHAEEDGKTEVISVTGTTVEHQLFTGRAPVSVITRADLAASGRATLGDILQSMPAQSNAGNAQVNAGGDGTTRINLRGLGAPRTLVLLNGRRIVNGGAGADAAVDINAIPLPVIERVEVLKDGASAIYGADAVGGVVNLVTRTQFDGTDVSLLTSTSQRGDGTEYAASFVTGFTTNDKRTYFVVSGGYQQHDPVFASDRAFSAIQRSYDFATRTEARNTSLAAPSGRLDVLSIGAGGMQPPGCSSNVCKPAGNGGWNDFVEPGDLYNEAAASYVYTPSTRYSVFASAGNRLTDNTAVLLELLYLHRNSDRQLSPVAFSADSPISQFNMYNPLGADIADYRRRITEIGPRRYVDDVGMLRFIVGLTGNLPGWLGRLEGWNYEVSENYGITDAVAGTTGQLLKTRVADSLGPSMLDRSGVPICVRTPGDASTKILYKVPVGGGGFLETACVPVNLFAPAGTIPRDQLKNLTFTDAGQGTDTQRSFLVTTGGRIAELPDHGDISLSLGGDYRSEVGEQRPPEVASLGNTTDNAAGATEGQFHIFEGFGELTIVPISGHDIAQWVELDLGARVLRHSRFGSSVTYKASGLFRTAHGIAVRGTYATALRTPSLFDLFGGRTERSVSAEDPCDTRPPSVGDGTRTLDPMVQAQCTSQGVPVASKLTTGQQLSVIGGNRDLAAETAATTTIGVVVEPPQVKGLAVSADYWRIAIDDAIETLGIQTIFANCYDRGIQAYCDQIHRDPGTSRVRSVDQFLQNVPRTTTSGVDVALWYDTRLGGLGRIHTGFEAQYLVRYDLDTSLQVIHGAGFYDLGVYPRYKANLSSDWVHRSGASAGFTLRFVGTYKECAGNDCNSDHNLAVASRDVDRYVKVDLFGGYEVRSGAGTTTLQVGVNNLFDASPPVVYNAAAANSDATTYDFIGRMVYVRLSQHF